MKLAETAEWAALEELAKGGVPDIRELLDGEEGRMEHLALAVTGIRFDFTRLPLAAPHWWAMEALAEVADVAGWRDRMAKGAIVNGSEGRAATHMQLRGKSRDRAIPELAERIRRQEFGPVESLIHIGIGGSALGPKLLLDALAEVADGPRIYVASNIDGVALKRAFEAFDPRTTWLIVVSKTFTTQETFINLESARRWLAASGIAEPMARVFAVTAAPEKARAAGVPDAQILVFDESIGGRYSMWSGVGLPVAIHCGPAVFAELLDGAAAMDRHFLDAPPDRNVPMLAAMADVWAAVFCRRATRGIFAYDQRLRSLPGYLQQLEMESNGKSVDRDGDPVTYPTAPIVWGGTGTDVQHAVFQLLHQGTHTDPVEFVAVKESGRGLDAEHHRLLLANCFAQSAALLRGRSFGEALARAGGNRELAAARMFPGNRGSTTILLERLSPRTLGALLAFYEARTFVFATLIGINPFDQWGVELGKKIACHLAEGDFSDLDPATRALLDAAGF